MGEGPTQPVGTAPISGAEAARAPRPSRERSVRERVARRLRGDSGQSVVEFGLVVPLLCVLVLAFVDFGKAMNYWIDLTHVANQGARLAAVNAPGVSDFQSYVKGELETNELQSGSSSVDPATVSVCYPAGAEVGDPVTVQVATTYHWIPFIGGSWTLKGNATMRLEQLPTNVPASGSCS